MERSWWWKAFLYGALVALACLYLVPTVVPENSQPAFIKKYFQKRIQLGLDLQGGLHLVYEVHVDKAVSDKVDRIASEIEDRIKKDEGKKDDKDAAKKTAGVTISREGRDDIVVTFKNPAENVLLGEDVLREFRKQLDLVSRDPATGVVRLRLDPDQIEEVRDSALAISGLLVEHPGGHAVKPYQPPGLWEAVSFNNAQKYVQDKGEGNYRRSLYTYWKRQSPPPNMLIFDAPTR